MDGELHETGDIVDVELAHHAGTVGVDGLRADGEAGGDFFGTEALNEHGEHLMFAGAEGFYGIVLKTAATLGSEYLFHLDGGGDVNAAIADLAKGIEELLGSPGFQDKTLGAATKGLDDGFAVRSRGHENHAGIAGGFPDAAEEFQSVNFREVEIEQGHVGPELENLPESGGAIGALTYHLKIAAEGAECGQSFPQERKGFRD